MKIKLHQIILLPCLLIVFSLTTFAQSVTILPEFVTNQSNTGINYNITDNSDEIGIQSNRFNGTLTSKLPVTLNQNILKISGGGFFDATSSDQQASMRFVATENYNPVGSGTRINFWTTANGTANEVDRMVINHDGNIGIGQSSPSERLHINGGLRVSNLAGTGVRNTYVSSTGVLTSAAQSRTITVAPMSFQRRNVNTTGIFTSYGVYGDCFISSGSTDHIVAPINIPVGAVITGITFSYTDNSPTQNFRFYFIKNSTSTTSNTSLSDLFQNTINASTFNITTISSGTLNETVDAGEYFFVLVIPVNVDNSSSSSWGSYMSIKGVQVSYSL